MLSKFKENNFVLYIVIGLLSATLDMITLSILTRIAGVHEQIASPISMSVGIINSFFLNAYFNFKKKDKLLIRFISFYSVGLVGIAITAGILYIFNDMLGGDIQRILDSFFPILASFRLEIVKAFSIVVIAIVQYFLNKKISFNF